MSRTISLFTLSLILAATSTSVSQAGLWEPDDVFSSGSDSGVYVQGNFAASIFDLESGGFNTLGPHFNTGDSQESVPGVGGAIGVSKQYDRYRVRLEVEGMWRDDSTHLTNSFPGPPGPITFFYTVEADQNWSAMTNLWFDVPVRDRLSAYAGGGIGAAGTHLTVNDTVVFGQGSSTNFTYQVGTGLILPVGENVELDLGYRFLDAGEANVDLDGGVNGEYTADLLMHQLMFAVRLKLR